MSVVIQEAAGVSDGAAAIIIGQIVRLAGLQHHQSIGLHGGNLPVGEPAGLLGIGTGFANGAAARSQRQYIGVILPQKLVF